LLTAETIRLSADPVVVHPPAPGRNAVRATIRNLTPVAVVAAACIALLPRLSQLRTVPALLAQAQWPWIGAGLVLYALTYVSATVALHAVSRQRLDAGRTLVVQLGATFMSRIMPASIGRTATNIAYLRNSGDDLAGATASVLAITAIGTMVHLSLTVIALLLVGGGSLSWATMRVPPWLPFVAGLAAVCVLLGLSRTQQRLLGLARRLADPVRRGLLGVLSTLSDPRRLTFAALGSAGVSLGHLATLVVCVHAFGGHVSVARITIVYLVGSTLGAAATVPGGLGAFEASTVAALSHFGMHLGPALSATLAFRLLTFWLPLAPGFLAWRDLRRKAIL
jgi:uncharacterized protein (TIRG00374 family)